VENITSDNNSDLNSDEGNFTNRTKRNCGRRIKGPFVCGLCFKNNGVLERRFFLVERCDRATVISII